MLYEQLRTEEVEKSSLRNGIYANLSIHFTPFNELSPVQIWKSESKNLRQNN